MLERGNNVFGLDASHVGNLFDADGALLSLKQIEHNPCPIAAV
jgi:hypothetical protein